MSQDTASHMRSAQTNAFAMQYGFGLGIYQIVIGSFFISSLSSPQSSLWVLILLLAVPLFSAQLMLRFRNSVGEGRLSFGRGFKFGLLLYLYAGLILALATYIYFAYFDHGTLANHYAALLSQPENAAALSAIQPGFTAEQFVQIVRDFKPAAYASNVVINNALAGAVISAITAAIIRK